jgi:hypothetical protein
MRNVPLIAGPIKSYDEVPPDVLADPESLISWAGEAIRCQ